MFERDLGDGWKVAELMGGELALRRNGYRADLPYLWYEDGFLYAGHDPVEVPARIVSGFISAAAEWESSNA